MWDILIKYVGTFILKFLFCVIVCEEGGSISNAFFWGIPSSLGVIWEETSSCDQSETSCIHITYPRGGRERTPRERGIFIYGTRNRVRRERELSSRTFCDFVQT